MTLNLPSFYNYILYLCLFFLTFSGNISVFEVDFFDCSHFIIYFMVFYQKIVFKSFNVKQDLFHMEVLRII